jgi:hypothetical protein
VYRKIHTVRNTILMLIDAFNLCFGKDYCSDVYDKDNPSHSYEHISSSTGLDATILDDFVESTMHRSENVDDISNLKKVLTAISDSKSLILGHIL